MPTLTLEGRDSDVSDECESSKVHGPPRIKRVGRLAKAVTSTVRVSVTVYRKIRVVVTPGADLVGLSVQGNVVVQPQTITWTKNANE